MKEAVLSNCLYQNYSGGNKLSPMNKSIGLNVANKVLKIFSPIQATATIFRYFDQPINIPPYYVVGLGGTAKHVFSNGKHIYLTHKENFFIGIRIEGKEWQRRKERLNCPVSDWMVNFQYSISYFLLVSEQIVRLEETYLRNNPSFHKSVLVMGYPINSKEIHYSLDQIKQVRSFVVAVGNDAERGMSGGPVYSFDKQGNAEMIGLLISGCWVPSKVVVQKLGSRMSQQQQISRDQVNFLTDDAFVKVLDKCPLQNQRLVVLETWRNMMKAIKKLDKDQFKLMLFPLVEAQLYKEWQTLLSLSKTRYRYCIVHSIFESISSVIQSIRVDDIDESKLGTAFEINRTHSQAFELVKFNKDKFREYRNYLYEQNTRDFRKSHTIFITVKAKDFETYSVSFDKEVRYGKNVCTIIQELWVRILSSVPPELNHIYIQIQDLKKVTKQQQHGVDGLEWLQKQILNFTGLDPKIIYD